MSNIAIKVENLSKCYQIGHNTAQAERYSALRDVIANNAKNLARKTRDMFHGKAIVQGDEVEEFWALKDINFEIKQGDRVGIIGRNGAGKSTLLKILSRITEPTTGRISINGRVASLLEVGTGFHPELTGRENIFLNGAILGMSRKEIQRKFDEIVDFAEVEKFLDTPVKRYSSGMYVRLAFAVAAHLEPETLIVDEVLAVGDASFQKKCLGKMQDISREGRTIIFVSHNMGALMSLCDNGLWLVNGSIHMAASPREIIGKYLSDKTTSGQKYLELKTLTRKYENDNRLRFISLEWLCDLPLRHGEPLKARIQFKTKKHVEDVSVGIGFSTIDGKRLLTYETDFQESKRSNLVEKKIYSTTIEVESLPLIPGIYSLDIGSRSGDTHSLDYLPNTVQLEVIPGLKTPSHIIQTDTGVRLSSCWSTIR